MSAGVEKREGASAVNARLAAYGPEAHAATQGYFQGVVVKLERTIAVVRIVTICWFVIPGFFDPWPTSLHVLRIGLFALALAFSVWTLWTFEQSRSQRWRLYASVFVDALTAAAGAAPAVITAGGSGIYSGFINNPIGALPVLTILVAGLRLSLPVVAFGVVLGYGQLIGATAWDFAVNNGEKWLTWRLLLDSALLVAVAALVAFAVAYWAKRLTFEGALHSVRAVFLGRHLKAHLPARIAELEMEKSQPGVSGSNRMVAVLFCDLRGFTAYAENLPPQQVVAELNAYFECMMEPIAFNGGIVDKFIGDAIMGLFGVPQDGPQDAANAIRAAVAMNEALAEHNRGRRAAGRPLLACGVGLHYGPAIVGNIGSATRLQFTAIGDAVNLASRIEALTKTMGTPILVSDACRRAAEQAATDDPLPQLDEVGEVDIRGRSSKVKLFAVVDPPAQGAAGAAAADRDQQ